MGAHFTNHLSIGDFISPIHRDVSIANNSKCVRPPDALFACSISAFSFPLVQLAQFLGVRCIPDLLVLGIFPQFFVFNGLSRFFVNFRH